MFRHLIFGLVVLRCFNHFNPSQTYALHLYLNNNKYLNPPNTLWLFDIAVVSMARSEMFSKQRCFTMMYDNLWCFMVMWCLQYQYLLSLCSSLLGITLNNITSMVVNVYWTSTWLNKNNLYSVYCGWHHLLQLLQCLRPSVSNLEKKTLRDREEKKGWGLPQGRLSGG